MRTSYYVMHKLLRYAKNLLRYAAIITLCVVITLCGVTHVYVIQLYEQLTSGREGIPVFFAILYRNISAFRDGLVF